MPNHALEIQTTIAGRAVSRREIQDWEARRAVRVLRKLGVDDVTGSVRQLRDRLLERKLELGYVELERRLARELAVADVAGAAAARLSFGRRQLCTIELRGTGGSAEIVPDWYASTIAANEVAPLLAACPDHYSLRTRADGAVEVIETTGGSPAAVRMLFDADTRTLRSPTDASFGTEWAGSATTNSGTVIGGIRHLFADRPDGFHARLTVEFPRLTAPHMVAAHRWHLACEFSNWIESANQSAS